MREQVGTWIACLVLVTLVAMAAKGEEPVDYTVGGGPADWPTKPILARAVAPAWRQMPIIEPGTFDSRLIIPEPLSIELRRGGSEYRITSDPAEPGHVEIRERFGELVGVRVGMGCSVEVVDHDRKAEK